MLERHQHVDQEEEQQRSVLQRKVGFVLLILLILNPNPSHPPLFYSLSLLHLSVLFSVERSGLTFYPATITPHALPSCSFYPRNVSNPKKKCHQANSPIKLVIVKKVTELKAGRIRLELLGYAPGPGTTQFRVEKRQLKAAVHAVEDCQDALGLEQGRRWSELESFEASCASERRALLKLFGEQRRRFTDRLQVFAAFRQQARGQGQEGPISSLEQQHEQHEQQCEQEQHEQKQEQQQPQQLT